MRDTAVSGLGHLLRRPEWRESRWGAAISTAVEAGLHDPSAVVRMRAADEVRTLHSHREPADRVAVIGVLLQTESDPNVRAQLIGKLYGDVASAPEAVDTVLAAVLQDHVRGAEALDELHLEVTLPLLAYLALVPATPFAQETAGYWCAHAPENAKVVERFAVATREHLREPGAGQRAAFRLLSEAADACLARWSKDPAEHVPSAELTDQQRDELIGAVTVAHDIGEQVYFASGAFAARDGEGSTPPHDLAGFAELAFPLLHKCAALGVPQCVHPVVETLIFLGALDEKRALLAIAQAIPDGGAYAGDPLAGAEILTYLRRLLAEQRPLVLHDPEGSPAFARLLAVLAGAGNQEALELAYTFAEVFR